MSQGNPYVFLWRLFYKNKHMERKYAITVGPYIAIGYHYPKNKFHIGSGIKFGVLGGMGVLNAGRFKRNPKLQNVG